VATGSAVLPKLLHDWAASGPGVFRLDIMEKREQKPDRTEAEFLDDLRTLESLWRAQLDASKAY
jgi:hypothetical protein